LVHLP
jgi:hypothetical protein